MKGKNIGKPPINKGIKLKDEEKQQLVLRSKHRKNRLFL